jgi:uncharacterized membrane protein YeaQ/YmgE (transglycosylase-associated protein family)
MGFVISIVVGGIIGWAASIFAKTNAQMGIVANVIVGIVGSALGHWLAGMLGLATSNMVLSLAVSIGGAMLLIALLKVLGVFNKKK